jgi:hypothetical protein
VNPVGAVNAAQNEVPKPRILHFYSHKPLDLWNLKRIVNFNMSNLINNMS